MKNPNKLNIDTIHADWCDKDIVMLHACFQLLTDCVEKEELLNGNTDWNFTEEHKNAKKEIKTLYSWWNKRKTKIKQERTKELDQKQYEEDNEMLIRLIKVRKHLWT